MQYKITKAIDALILAAVIEGGVSDEKLPASRELTNLRKSELIEAISAPCLHQIQEPAPATAMDALREAEAALEVAMARILKADPGHSICVTSEAKALVAVRAALAAPAPMLVAQPQLHAALFAARGALQHMKEGGKPTQSLLNEAIAAIDSVAVTQAAPAAVAVQLDVNGIAQCPLCGSESKHVQAGVGGHRILCWNDDCECSSGYFCSKEEAITSWNARAALAVTPAAAPVVLPEPVTWLIERSAFHVSPHGQDAESNEWLEEAHEPGEEGSFPVYTEQQVRALLATGGQAQAVEQAPVLYVSKGQLDNHSDPDGPDSANAGRYLPARITPAGNFTMPLFAAPQAQADARDAESDYRRGYRHGYNQRDAEVKGALV